MDIVDIVLKVALTLCSIFLVILVLLQQGKGADAGAAFGGGASQTVFGSSGSGNFLTKSTWWLGFIFFGCALALAFKAQNHQMSYEPESVMLELPTSAETESPATDVPADVESEQEVNVTDPDVPVVMEIIDDAEVDERVVSDGQATENGDVPGDVPAEVETTLVE